MHIFYILANDFYTSVSMVYNVSGKETSVHYLYSIRIATTSTGHWPRKGNLRLLSLVNDWAVYKCTQLACVWKS